MVYSNVKMREQCQESILLKIILNKKCNTQSLIHTDFTVFDFTTSTGVTSFMGIQK
jgi:hypothetical protein